LFERLNINKHLAVESKESLKPSNERTSDSVKAEIKNLVQEGRTVLVKIQWADIRGRNLPLEIRDEIPNLNQKIVMLYTSPSIIVERLKNDPSPNRRVVNEKQAISHLSKMICHVLRLEKLGLPIIWINTDNFDYKIIDRSRLTNILKNLNFSL